MKSMYIEQMSPKHLRHNNAMQLSQYIIGSIAEVPGVERVMTFGSLVDNAFDAFSDVDLFVVIDPNDWAWAVADVIRAHHPVLFYRMFSTDRQPAGRYWFKDQSPMTRLDISFHSPQAMSQIVSTGMYMGHQVMCRTCYERDAINTTISPASSIKQRFLHFTDEETHLGSCIYRLSCAIRHAMRHSSL